MLVTSAWSILEEIGLTIIVAGTFTGRDPGQHLPVVVAAAKVANEHGNQYAMIAHEALYNLNPDQVESLLSIVSH